MTSMDYELEINILKKEIEILKDENIKIKKQRDNYFNQRKRITKKWKQAAGEVFLLKEELIKYLTDDEIDADCTDILISTDNNS